MTYTENGKRWVDLTEFPGYRVSDEGDVESRRTNSGRLRSDWKRLKQQTRRGYRDICLSDGTGMQVIRSVHRLVLEAFIGPAPDGCQACHYDGNPENNCASNLRWDTAVANWDDRKRHGRGSDGSRNGRSKLSDADAVAIYKECEACTSAWSDIADRYEIGKTQVSNIARCKTYVKALEAAGCVIPLQAKHNFCPGESHQNSTLSDSQVVAIFRIAHRGVATQRRIAEWFGIAQATVGGIARGVKRSETLRAAGCL